MNGYRLACVASCASLLASVVTVTSIPPQARAALLKLAPKRDLHVIALVAPLTIGPEVGETARLFSLPRGSRITPKNEWVVATDVTVTPLTADPGSTAVISASLNRLAALGLTMQTLPGGGIEIAGSGLSGRSAVTKVARPVTLELLNCPQFGSINGGQNELLLSIAATGNLTARIATRRVAFVRVPARVCGQRVTA